MEKKPLLAAIHSEFSFGMQQPSKISIHTHRALRTFCVSVRLNNAELTKLNTLRKHYSKGEWLRMAYLKNFPTVIPTINIEAWKSLSDISQKLNRIAIHIDGKSEDSQLTHTELFAVKRQLKELRQHLLNADIWSKPDEGYAEDQER